MVSSKRPIWIHLNWNICTTLLIGSRHLSQSEIWSLTNVHIPHFKVGSALHLSQASVIINWSSNQRIFKFEVCVVHHLYLSANLNKGFQQNNVFYGFLHFLLALEKESSCISSQNYWQNICFWQICASPCWTTQIQYTLLCHYEKQVCYWRYNVKQFHVQLWLHKSRRSSLLFSTYRICL